MMDEGRRAEAIAVLTDVASLLEWEGWCQGTYRDGAGRRCLWGAVGAVICRMDLPLSLGSVLEAVQRAIRQEIDWAGRPSGTGHDDLVGVVAAWNDGPGRTVEEVIAMVRNAKRWL